MQTDYNHYRDFTEEDFLADPTFQEWVLAPSDANEAFWQNLKLQYPAKSATIENARLLLAQLKFKEEFPSDALVNAKYQDFQKRIAGLTEDNLKPSVQHNLRHRIIPWRAVSKIAAVATGLILVSYLIILLINTGTTESWSTAYGEHKTIYLPDSTLVVLNSKSQVSISKWKDGQPREVWLEGEAYFDVRHVQQSRGDTGRLPFTVHTKQVVINVIGTAFDVRERRGLTEVVLQRGLINLKVEAPNAADIQSRSTGNTSPLSVMMRPGDHIVYNPSVGKFNRSAVDVTDYLKWREKKLLLIDPTAGEICKYLEDNFGKRIVFEDTTLQHKKIEGPILINNLDDALFVVSTVLNTRIAENDSVVILRTKK